MCRILWFFIHSTVAPYLDSNVFLTMINFHLGSIFKLLLLSEATSVFSAANKNILIMHVLFFCGPARSYILKTHAHLQIWGTGGLQMSSLLKKSNTRTVTFSSRLIGHQCIMFQSTISHQEGDWKNKQHVTNVRFSNPYMLPTLANWLHWNTIQTILQAKICQVTYCGRMTPFST